MQPTLILFSGLPGCGKTSLARQVARHLSISLLTKDRVQQFLRSRGMGTPADGYYFLFDQSDEQLALGVSVILDAVFPQAGFRAQAREVAEKRGAPWKPIYCLCSDEALWRERMSSRVQYVPGWTPVGWEEVERLRGDFLPWCVDEALIVDSVQPMEANLARVLDYLR
jgi:predicted kinase